MAQRDRAADGRAAARSNRSTSRGNRPPVSGGRPSAGGEDLAAHRARLRTVIAPVLASAGYDLEDLSVSRAGRRHLLRVIVDSDSGVSLDTIADLSRSISAALDQAEEAGGAFTAEEYVLEVSSPGIDRPLTEPRHWRRNIGRLVSVKAGERQLTARISTVDEDKVVLDLDGHPHEVGYAQLGPGRVQVEFNRLDEMADEDLAEFNDEQEEDEP
jgi:ribosome maturation factor RimP